MNIPLKIFRFFLNQYLIVPLVGNPFLNSIHPSVTNNAKEAPKTPPRELIKKKIIVARRIQSIQIILLTRVFDRTNLSIAKGNVM
jgi:hypothetical protein